MAGRHGDGGWLYHLPGFLDRVRDRGAQSVRESVDVDVGGVLYHHRGARVPAHDATFVWRDDGGPVEGETDDVGADGGRYEDGESHGAVTFDLELDAVGSRSAWVRFDASRAWDVFLVRSPGDAPCLAWMTDAEFRTEEADEFGSKQESMAMMRFSFGLYLQSPGAWADVEARAAETDAACFVYRPGGRTLVPEGDLAEYERLLPPELFDGDAPPYLGAVEAHVEGG